MPRFCLKNDKIIDMKLEKLPEEFVQAKPVLEKIIEHGFEAYFVGGSVRDILLGRDSRCGYCNKCISRGN